MLACVAGTIPSGTARNGAVSSRRGRRGRPPRSSPARRSCPWPPRPVTLTQEFLLVTDGAGMVHRGELTDQQWQQISSLLPDGGRQGGQWRDHRQVINGILWQARTGAPWRDVPDRYGPWKTLHERLRRWSADGTWERIFEHVKVSVQAEEAGLDEAVYKAYSARATRRYLRRRRIAATIGGKEGSADPPQETRGAGRPAVRFRSGDLQAAQRGGTRDRAAQAVPRAGLSPCRTRGHLPQPDPAGRHRGLALMIHGTGLVRAHRGEQEAQQRASIGEALGGGGVPGDDQVCQSVRDGQQHG